MMSFIWPWAFAILPLPFVLRLLLPRAKVTNDAALLVPDLSEYQLDDKYFEHTEDISKQGIIGNYVHGNEPSHHVSYMYNWTDEPWRSQERIQQILQTMYQNSNDGL